MPGIRRNVADTGTEVSIVTIALRDNCVETRLLRFVRKSFSQIKLVGDILRIQNLSMVWLAQL